MTKKVSLWQMVFYSSALLILLLIFSAYYAPEMMFAITNQIWAFCGW